MTPTALFRGRIFPLAAALGVASVALGAFSADPANAKMYFVSAAGNDTASGLSASTPWRSVARVNRARLRPGDKVVFRAKDRFPGVLSPERSGRLGKRILYTSYGKGRAKLPDGVFLRSVSHLQIDQLEIVGASQGIAGSSGGRGARNIAITRNRIANVDIGINAPNQGDINWRIRKNHITLTDDSAIILEGKGARVRDNLIAHSGRDRSIPYGKHGVYAKASGTWVLGNRIIHFAEEGVSTRYRNARIAGNLIRYGGGGIGFYSEDSRRGTTRICRNSISNVNFGIYIDADGLRDGDAERFQIRKNRIHKPGGPLIDAPDRLDTVSESGNRNSRSLKLLSPSCS